MLNLQHITSGLSPATRVLLKIPQSKVDFIQRQNDVNKNGRQFHYSERSCIPARYKLFCIMIRLQLLRFFKKKSRFEQRERANNASNPHSQTGIKWARKIISAKKKALILKDLGLPTSEDDFQQVPLFSAIKFPCYHFKQCCGHFELIFFLRSSVSIQISFQSLLFDNKIKGKAVLFSSHKFNYKCTSKSFFSFFTF